MREAQALIQLLCVKGASKISPCLSFAKLFDLKVIYIRYAHSRFVLGPPLPARVQLLLPYKRQPTSN
jgi:hypothetical protein